VRFRDFKWFLSLYLSFFSHQQSHEKDTEETSFLSVSLYLFCCFGFIHNFVFNIFATTEWSGACVLAFVCERRRTADGNLIQ
jgi:hypothetical protein